VPTVLHLLGLDHDGTEGRPLLGALDAAAEGATDGLRLALNVAAMLVAFVSLIALLNWPLAALSEVDAGWLPIAHWRESMGLPVLTFQNILGILLQPLAWLMGAGSESRTVASLMGEQVIATEFVAYADLASQVKAQTISPRAQTISTYALCGFANLASIAIQIGGLGACHLTQYFASGGVVHRQLARASTLSPVSVDIKLNVRIVSHGSGVAEKVKKYRQQGINGAWGGCV
jgi:nucleoside permease NupC